MGVMRVSRQDVANRMKIVKKSTFIVVLTFFEPDILHSYQCVVPDHMQI